MRQPRESSEYVVTRVVGIYQLLDCFLQRSSRLSVPGTFLEPFLPLLRLDARYGLGAIHGSSGLLAARAMDSRRQAGS